MKPFPNWSIILRAHFALLLLLVSMSGLAEVKKCEVSFLDGKVQQAFFGDTPYRIIKKSSSWDPKDLFEDYSPNDIFLGFSFGHSYFMVRNHRYDGAFGLIGDRPSIRERSELTPGVVIRIKDAPREMILKLNESLEAHLKPFSLTCSAGVCSYLTKAGLNLPIFARVSPSSLLKSILKNGVKRVDGTVLEVDLTVLGGRSIERSIHFTRLGDFLGSLPLFGPLLLASLLGLLASVT